MPEWTPTVRVENPLGQPATVAGNDALEPGTRMRLVLTELLILALFALAAGPNLLEKFNGGSRQNTVGDIGPDLTIVRYTQLALIFVVLSTCFGLFLYRPGRLLRVALNPFVMAILLIWVTLTGNDLAAGHPPTVWSLIFPVVVLALWISCPPVEALAAVGWGGLTVAVVSMALGALAPAVGIYRNAAGVPTVADKGLISDNLLAGVFTSTNNLGQMLSLALPFVFMLRSRLLRTVGAAAILAAIVWCGSRSSIAAAGVCLLMLLALAKGKRAGERNAARWSQLAFMVAACLSFAIPFVPFRDITFSGRQNIWVTSLRYWQDSKLFGLGSRWYADVAGLHTDFGPRSEFFLFHAHNQILQFLVTGGLVCAGLFVYAMYRLGNSIDRLQEWYRVAAAYLVSFWVSGSLEVNLGVVDRYQFYGTALVPLVVLAVGAERVSASQPTPRT